MPRVDHTHNIIEVDHVSFSYGGTEVLRDVTLAIHKGDYLAVVGGNGAGKSTLLKIMLGLLAPAKGTVRLFGVESARFKERSKIGYVPQKATSFDGNFPASVAEVVRMGRYGICGLGRRLSAEDRRKADEALDRVGMSAYAHRLIDELSRGQEQRVFIARALAAEPEVIFLDEPTVGVEQRVKNEFYALLQSLNEDLGVTIVLITHDLESVGNKAMHVACVDRTLYFHRTVSDYLQSTRGVTHTHHDAA